MDHRLMWIMNFYRCRHETLYGFMQTSLEKRKMPGHPKKRLPRVEGGTEFWSLHVHPHHSPSVPTQIQV